MYQIEMPVASVSREPQNESNRFCAAGPRRFKPFALFHPKESPMSRHPIVALAVLGAGDAARESSAAADFHEIGHRYSLLVRSYTHSLANASRRAAGAYPVQPASIGTWRIARFGRDSTVFEREARLDWGYPFQ
jgi:hypothetical protein